METVKQVLVHLLLRLQALHLCREQNAVKTVNGRDYLFVAIKKADRCIGTEVNAIAQKEMYQHLFDRFHLNPEECFFVDDLSLNIEGARKCGMDGYCFEDGDVDKLKTVLASLNR